MTNLILFLIALVWPLGQLLRLSPIDSSFRFHLLDLLIILLALNLVFKKEFWRVFWLDKMTLPLILFILAASLSLLIAIPLFPSITLLSAFFYLLRFVFYWFIYYSLRFTSLSEHKNKILFSCFLFVVFGLIQYFVFPDMRFLKSIGFDDHYFRLIGTFFDPNFTGLVLVVLLLLNLNSNKTYLIVLRSLILLIALGFTFSRASFLALAFSLIIYSTLKRQFRFLIILAVLAIVIYLVPKPFGEGVNLFRTFSIISRLESHQYAFDIFKVNPITGIGFNTLKANASGSIPSLSSGIDNSYLFVLATTGLIGFISFLILLFFSLWGLPVHIFVSCLAILFHSLFNNTFFYSWILIVYLALISSFSIKRKSKRSLSLSDSQLDQPPLP